MAYYLDYYLDRISCSHPSISSLGSEALLGFASSGAKGRAAAGACMHNLTGLCRQAGNGVVEATEKPAR